MRYVKDTPLEVGHRVYQLRPPTPSITVIVKGAFDPVEGAPARISEEQVTTTGEVFTDDDPERSQRLPSDFALLKPKGECFVIGKAWSQRPERMIACSFKIGKIGKSFAVFGDRAWQRGITSRPSDAVPFTQMDIGLERAYGGPGFEPNPWGRGREPIETESGPQHMLPNVEDPRALASSPSNKPAPVVLGPLPPSWPARRKLAGTYGDKYMKTRWPWLPEDFDWRWFMEAPADQQLEEGFWKGDEPFEAHNLHPSIPAFRSRLPGIAPRVFLDIVPPNGGTRAFREVRLYLDTVTWDAELGKLLLVWRGSTEIANESLDDTPHVFIAHELLSDRPKSAEELRARMDALLKEEEGEEKEAEGVEPPALETPPTPEPEPEAEVPEPEPSEEEKELEAKMAELEKQLAGAGMEPPQGPDAAPKPLDPAAMLESMRAAGVPITPEMEAMIAEMKAPPEPEAPEEPEAEPAPEPPPPEARAVVLARLQAGEPLTELDLTGADLSGLDLSRRDLSSSILANANFENARLTQARLLGTTLRNAQLPRVDLSGANLTGADLEGAILIGATLDGCVLEDADLTDAKLAFARLTKVKAARASFVGADLSEAVLAEADLSEADLERAKLDRADLRKAILRDATLEDASAEQARFQEAVMTKSRGAGLRAKEAQFGSIDAVGSFWERSEVSRADFGFAKLTGADFTEAVAIGTNFDGASLEKARFERANVHSIRARKANLFEANFDSATLSYADLRGANLFGAEVWRAKLDNVQLELADVTRTKLERK